MNQGCCVCDSEKADLLWRCCAIHQPVRAHRTIERLETSVMGLEEQIYALEHENRFLKACLPLGKMNAKKEIDGMEARINHAISILRGDEAGEEAGP